MSNADRAQQIIQKLDLLTQELKDLAVDGRGRERVVDLRTEMGFEKGGYIGHMTFDDMLENELFADDTDEEE